MNLRPNQSTTRLAALAIATLFLTLGSGCENTDWNWDTTWWRKPRRTVRPVRRTTTPPATKPQKAARQTEPAEPKATPPKDTATLNQTGTAANEPARPAQPAGPAPSAQPQVTSDAESTQPRANPQPQPRPYYQLYFLSGPGDTADRGQQTLKLARASARGCAGIVEMLCVPMGKSGSRQECYLLYEEPDEFKAAAAIAPDLDIAPLEEAPTTTGANEAFDAGVGMLLGILAKGIEVEPTAISSCERLLAEALQSKQLQADRRWMAGILAGRLVSEFRFDYPTAESYYRQALQHVKPESIEDMVGRWWLADALVQQGRALKAEAVYRGLLRTYGDWWPDSHIVKRSRAWLSSPR